MFRLKTFALSTVAAALLTGVAVAPAQVSIGIGVGGGPNCPYGYYGYAPYNCAPYGYYGPDWFNGGLFIGAGPYFHGPHGFYGHVDNRYDPHFGYHGPYPDRGAEPFNHFHGNVAVDNFGHPGNAGHGPEGERGGGFVGGGGHPR